MNRRFHAELLLFSRFAQVSRMENYLALPDIGKHGARTRFQVEKTLRAIIR